MTPAHDFMDFHLSQKHSLPRPSVIRGDGTMEPLCGQWLEVQENQCARYVSIPVLSMYDYC